MGKFPSLSNLETLLQFMVFSTMFSSKKNTQKWQGSKRPSYQFGQVDLDLSSNTGWSFLLSLRWHLWLVKFDTISTWLLFKMTCLGLIFDYHMA